MAESSSDAAGKVWADAAAQARDEKERGFREKLHSYEIGYLRI